MRDFGSWQDGTFNTDDTLLGWDVTLDLFAHHPWVDACFPLLHSVIPLWTCRLSPESYNLEPFHLGESRHLYTRYLQISATQTKTIQRDKQNYNKNKKKSIFDFGGSFNNKHLSSLSSLLQWLSYLMGLLLNTAVLFSDDRDLSSSILFVCCRLSLTCFLCHLVSNLCCAMFFVIRRASFLTKTVPCGNELHKFLIWDTAGQERVSRTHTHTHTRNSLCQHMIQWVTFLKNL